jgi:predicted enzyme related to lactoylglutathione lyase
MNVENTSNAGGPPRVALRRRDDLADRWPVVPLGGTLHRKEVRMDNAFVHVELHTNDLPRAKEFYSKLFDWKLQDMPMPGGGGIYTTIDVGSGTGGGMMTNQALGTPPHWMAYVGVDDVRASTKKARDLGAKVVVDALEVGEYGTMSVIVDPTGATLAMWQAKGGK